MITFGCIDNISHGSYDGVWLIVHSLKEMPAVSGCTWHPELSPSDELFCSYREWSRAGEWCAERFINDYVPAFIADFKADPRARASLDRLFTLGKTQDIHCVCFCPDESICHRSIIKGFLQGRQKKELRCDTVETYPDYSQYYALLADDTD